MTKRGFKRLDKKIEPLCRDLDTFEEDEEVVRIGDWGYLSVRDYESQFKSTRERYEYQAFSNSQSLGLEVSYNLEVISDLTDNLLDELLEELNDMDCAIYYTTAEE